jgi:prolyl-tRNA synthetase
MSEQTAPEQAQAMEGKDVIIKDVEVKTENKNEKKPAGEKNPGGDRKPTEKKQPQPKKANNQQQKKPQEALNRGEDLGITVEKEANLSAWFIQVIEKAELISYTDISGCFVLRPEAYAIWEAIQNHLGKLIKESGVRNCYFPCFVSQKALESEADNFEGFCPEVAWVTKSGQTELKQPIALRPTSEAIMYPQFAMWVRSHRDLPLRINQWCNVVRWEMKHCVPFLRSREFLWQEGHSAFATKEEADKEVLEILEYYRSVYEDLLAVPVTKGKKTEKEKFAGALYTTTVEGFIPTNGRAIQAATSHALGQNFSKVFKIEFEGEQKQHEFAWQNSWGLSTRTIGVMIMVHGDNKGLRIPPRAAEIQVVFVCIPKGDNINTLLEKAKELKRVLGEAGIRSHIDDRSNKPGWKYNFWETRGVPFRIEIGDRDIANESVMVCRRDNFQKTKIANVDLAASLKELINTMHNSMLDTAREVMNAHTKQCNTFSEFILHLNTKNRVLVPFCCGGECEENVKKRSKEESIAQQTDEAVELSGAAKSLCIPFEQPTLEAGTKCFGECGADATAWCLFGRSY